MTELKLQAGGTTYTADAANGRDISIALDFDGPQPNHFGASRASAKPMQAGGFIGDTREGGSCNAAVLTLNPHCNGTHTECLGHVTGERHDIVSVAPPAILPAALVSIKPVCASESDEFSEPAPRDGDKLITAESLARVLAKLPPGDYPALVVRTLPNPAEKRARRYTAGDDHPYFSLAAIELLLTRGVQHLLVDTPSIDRFDDEGLLAGHRLFWGLEKGAVEAGPNARLHATVTEMIFAEDDLQDGIYLLNLQLAPFRSDAAPSRPVLFPVLTA